MSNRDSGDLYKKVWNSVEDEEATLLSWVRNGTLFEPTLAELARRHMATAKFQLKKARELGRSAEGREVFADALFNRIRAVELLRQHQVVLAKAKPQTVVWYVKTDDADADEAAA